MLNDAGAFVAKEGLARISQYVGVDPTFATIEAIEREVRRISAPFGSLTDAQWRKLTRDSARERPEGGYGFASDPRLGGAFKGAPVVDVDLWTLWDAVRCPTLLLRGESSDVLPRHVARAMTRRGPKPKLMEFVRVVHAPALVSDDQIAAVRDFLIPVG